MEALLTAPCKGMNCGCTDGVSHSLECQAEHAAAIAGGVFVKAAKPEQQAQAGEPRLEDIEQYRLQMAGISTAALGYWKEGDGIHPDYDTLALRDVAKLYAKYDALYKADSKKDAALLACVEALKHLAHNARASGAEMGLAFAVADDAIAQANEVLGIKEGGV